MSQDNKVYTQKEMESAVELARLGGHMGYYTLEATHSFIEWAVQFEKTSYDEDNWMELIEDFGIQKMNEQVAAGNVSFVMPKVNLSQVQATLQIMKEAGLTLQVCLDAFGESQPNTSHTASTSRMKG